MDVRLLKQIKQLPPLPQSVIEIENIYQNPNSSFRDMAKVLEKDPMLTANLLKMANSPLYGFSREIQNVSQAVSLFGLGTVRGFALATIVKKGFKLDLSPYSITNSMFSELSLAQNTLAFRWFRKVDFHSLNKLATASFLVELGKLIISNYLIENDNIDYFKDISKQNFDITKAEVELLSTSTANISARIFKHWKFEEEIVDIMKYSDRPERASGKTKKIAAALHIIRSTINTDMQVTKENIENALILLDKYGFKQNVFLEAIETLKK